MAITDKALIFDEAVAITTGKMSTNVIDLNTIRDVAKGQPVYLNVYVHTAFSVATETVDINIANSSAVPNAADKKLSYGPYAASATVLGAKGLLLRHAIQEKILTQRYLSLSYVATTALATGKISTYLTIGGDSD
jgi:hypothetical protein